MNPRQHYGGTSRPHHLALNRDMCKAVTRTSQLLAGGVSLWGIIHGWPLHEIGLKAIATATLPPLAFSTHEQWASPDNDESEKWEKRHPFAQRYWWLYGVLTPHRSVWSHSALGTAARCIYGYWPMLLLLLLPSYVWMPILGLWGAGCVASDVAHYVLDDFSAVEMVTGKDKK
jgi:hypothetical protein